MILGIPGETNRSSAFRPVLILHAISFSTAEKSFLIPFPSGISEDEKRTAEELVRANAVNLYAQVQGIRFVKTPDELGGR